MHRVAGRLEFSVLSGVQFTLLRNQQSTKWSPLCESRSVNVLGEVVGFMRGAAGMECRDGCTLLFGEARPCCHAPRHRSAFSLAATEDALNISRKSRTEGPPLSGVGCRASVVGRRPRLAPNRLELNLLGPTLDVSNCLEDSNTSSSYPTHGARKLYTDIRQHAQSRQLDETRRPFRPTPGLSRRANSAKFIPQFPAPSDRVRCPGGSEDRILSSPERFGYPGHRARPGRGGTGA